MYMYVTVIHHNRDSLDIVTTTSVRLQQSPAMEARRYDSLSQAALAMSASHYAIHASGFAIFPLCRRSRPRSISLLVWKDLDSFALVHL